LQGTKRDGNGGPDGRNRERRSEARFRPSSHSAISRLTITSDAGLLSYRELDDTLHLAYTGADVLTDTRTGKNGRHRLVGLRRQSVFGRLAGYEDMNDDDRVCRDSAMRWVIGDRAITGFAAYGPALKRSGSGGPNV
jgi:hypothetical protein